MLCFPNAKINIGLNVVEKREDGFHNIETIFYPIGFTDVLEAVVAEREEASIQLVTTGIDIPGDPELNLGVRAYHLLAKDHKLPAVDMHLQKIIPIGAGIGGGSADGAFALNLLDDVCSLGLSLEEKLKYAVELGSDCPYFLLNEPCFATERGQKLQPIPLSLKGYHLVLVCPEVFISTAEAFADIKPEVSESSFLHFATNYPVEEWQEEVKNNFEYSIFSKYPELEVVKNNLLELGASYASMSGTGAAVYGIFKTLPELDSVSGHFTYTQEL